jgi:peptidoglycan/xylan/chitin deacetylase (PgdA/CDA1 family)
MTILRIFCIGFFAFFAFMQGFCGVSRAGMVTLVFDDGLKSVYQYAFPVLTQFGLPAAVGIIATRVDSGDPDFMDEKEVLELQDAGWEVASHSLTHKRPIDIPRLYTDEKCLDLRPISGRRGLYEAKYRYEELSGLMENDRLLKERADGQTVQSEPGTYYFDELISQIIVHPYATEDGQKQRVRAISYERELEESKRMLTSMGFNVTTYITPHNYWTPEMRDLSRKFYDQVTGGGDNSNRKGATDRYWLTRYVVHTNDTAEAIIDMVKQHAIRENGWVIFCMHGIGSDLGWEPWAVEKLAQLAAFLKKNNIPVVTVNQGVKQWFDEVKKPVGKRGA